MPKDIIELSDEISEKYGDSPALLFKPGFKYVLNNALSNCKTMKNKYNNQLFNLGMFFLLISILAIVLFTKYKGKINVDEKSKREKEKKIYILSTLQKMKDINRKRSDELITNLPSF